MISTNSAMVTTARVGTLILELAKDGRIGKIDDLNGLDEA